LGTGNGLQCVKGTQQKLVAGGQQGYIGAGGEKRKGGNTWCVRGGKGIETTSGGGMVFHMRFGRTGRSSRKNHHYGRGEGQKAWKKRTVRRSCWGKRVSASRRGEAPKLV